MEDQSLQGQNPKEALPQGAPATVPQRPRPKNLFVFCDGTGNEFVDRQTDSSNSNVVKLYTALKLDRDQFAYYHPGVGTMGDPTRNNPVSKWLSVITGLAFGTGFTESVLDAYRYLMQHYNSGDQVYIYGFSRGAYAARALAGLLHGYGLLCRGNEGHIPYAWRSFRNQVEDRKRSNRQSIRLDTTFRDTFSHRDFSIRFVGLWDTVSSVGWVSTPLRLLDMAQNSSIQRGRHAVSIDERRAFFQDNLWGDPVEVEVPVVLEGTPEGDAIPRWQDLLQVWFAGVHSDIGGSYKQCESGLSNITLKWMMDESAAAGAVFDEERQRMVLGVPKPPDEPTKLTAALALLYPKPQSWPLHRSLHGIWLALEILPHRYYDKDDKRPKKRIPLGAYRQLPCGALVHKSVPTRQRSYPDYKPKNLEGARLIPVPGTPYLSFQLSDEPRAPLRENKVIVFIVSVLELGLALYLGSRVVLWLMHHFHPVHSIIEAWDGWLSLKHIFISRFLNGVGSLDEFFWSCLLAFVIVAVAGLLSLRKNSY